MPANRSRTERWQDCLEQIRQRGGGLEFSVSRAAVENAGAPGAARGSDLIWRCRLLQVTETEIVVEQPTAMGHPLFIDRNVDLIGVMAIGQNRWMFRTTTLAPTPKLSRTGVMRIAMPTSVERVQRRQFYRVSTAELSLAKVECWPLLNPMSVGPAEAANRAAIEEAERTGQTPENREPSVLPEVGLQFQAQLVNIGGGGVGLMVDPSEARSIDRARLYWLRLDLTPHIPIPLSVTARLAHTHMDSTQSVYAGLSFDFTFNPSHQSFAVAQMVRYVEALQRAQHPEA